MNKNNWNKWRRYLIVSFIGIFLFGIFIPSCTYLSSANFDVLVRDKKPEAIADEKSLAEIVAGIPTAEQIQAMPLAQHPRLLASEARFAEIKEQIKTDKTMRKWYRKLHLDAEEYLRDDVPKYKFQDKIRMIDTSRLVLKRVTTLALIYRIDQNRLFLDRAWRELKAASEFPNWNPSHFLDTAEMTSAFAIGYDWLHKYWNQEQKNLISSTIVEKGLKSALIGYSQKTKWTETETNWNQVCNGSIGIGSLAVLDEYPVIASEAMYNSLQRIPKAMQHYAPDGAFDEGTSYWQYATRYNTIIIDALYSAIGTDFDLSQIAGFAKTGFFPIYMTGAFGIPFNFADSKERYIKSPQLFWMANKFEQPVYQKYQEQIAAPEALDLVWYNSFKDDSSFKSLSLDKYFRGSEIVSMRSEWKPQGIFVGFKGGNNQANHSNLDLGTFVLDALGVRWAVELGNDDYNLPGYFNEDGPRWNYYRMRAEGQNTLVINPNENPDQNPNASAKIINLNFTPQQASVTADLTSAYAPNVSLVYRKIILDRKRQQVLIEDKIEAETPVEAWWFMHTKAAVKMSKDRKNATLFQENAQLNIQIAGNNNYKFEIMDARPLSTSPNPKGQRENTDIYKLAIHLKNVSNEKLNVVFTLD